MNKLPMAKRVEILSMLCEGMSMRAVSRVAGASLNTVSKLMRDAGAAADAYHQEHLRGVPAGHIQCDELWSFVYSKEGNVERAKSAPPEAGDVWTFTAIDTATKVIPSYVVGPRDSRTALDFMDDLRGRVNGHPQISTDGLRAYVEAVDDAFGATADFAQIIKTYGRPPGAENDERRYSPADCTGIEKVPMRGTPDMDAANTSHVERNNLTIRMSVRRFTRLTNAFSKRLENHCLMLCIYFHWYNWCRPHSAVRTKRNNRVTPAMAAGLVDRPAKMEHLVEMVDALAPNPKRPRSDRWRQDSN